MNNEQFSWKIVIAVAALLIAGVTWAMTTKSNPFTGQVYKTSEEAKSPPPRTDTK